MQDSLSEVAQAARFTSKYRLLKEDGFDHVVRAENMADRYFRVFFVKNQWNSSRLGIISSKKILPRAIDRNRAKRIIREIFRQHGIRECGLDVVVMLRPAFAQEHHKRNDNLAILLGRVRDRCAK